jgi:hypothetical protein
MGSRFSLGTTCTHSFHSHKQAGGGSRVSVREGGTEGGSGVSGRALKGQGGTGCYPGAPWPPSRSDGRRGRSLSTSPAGPMTVRAPRGKRGAGPTVATPPRSTYLLVMPSSPWGGPPGRVYRDGVAWNTKRPASSLRTRVLHSSSCIANTYPPPQARRNQVEHRGTGERRLERCRPAAPTAPPPAPRPPLGARRRSKGPGAPNLTPGHTQREDGATGGESCRTVVHVRLSLPVEVAERFDTLRVRAAALITIGSHASFCAPPLAPWGRAHLDRRSAGKLFGPKTL